MNKGSNQNVVTIIDGQNDGEVAMDVESTLFDNNNDGNDDDDNDDLKRADNKWKKPHDQEQEIGVEDLVDDEMKEREEEEEEEEEDMEDGEPVAKRYQVFLSQTLASHLYLFQYPLRQQSRPYDFNSLKEMRFNKQDNKVELEFELNTRSEHYDDSLQQTSFSLSSSQVPLKANYAIGILRNQHLHITPLQNVLQFRPDMSHLINNDNFVGNTKEQVVKKSNPSKNTPNSKNNTNESSSSSSNSNFVPIDLFGKESSHSSVILEKLFQDSFNEVEFNMNARSYIDTLVPYKQDPLSDLRKGTISVSQLASEPAALQVKFAIIEAMILHYQRIKEIAYKARSDEEVLQNLDQIAVIVDGRWIARSEALEGSPRIAACRDYLLYLFETQKYVIRKEFIEKTGLSEEKALSMMKEISHLSDMTSIQETTSSSNKPLKRVWKLKLPKDDAFICEYPDYIKRHQQEWKNKEPIILKNVEQKFKNLAMKKAASARLTPKSAVASAVAVAPDETEKQLKIFFLQLFRKYKVCSTKLVRAEFEKKKAEDVTFRSIGNEMCAKILLGIAQKYNGGFILRFCEKPDYDKFRKVLIRLFESKSGTPVSMDEIQKTVETELKGDKLPPAGFALLTGELADMKGRKYVAKQPK